jgi:hypothetical protein
MKLTLTILTLSITALGFTGCADEGMETGTTSFALTDAEGDDLEACISELEACRETVESGEEFREECGELYACLPDRETEGAREDDWRRFCAAVAERCANAEASDEDCAGLQERCDMSFAGSGGADAGDRGDDAASEMSREQGMCIRTCQEGGGTEADCAAECTPA